MMTKLSEADMGRIAQKMIIHLLVMNGEIPDKDKIKRDLPNKAKALGETIEDLEQFTRSILSEVIRQRLGCKMVALQWNE